MKLFQFKRSAERDPFAIPRSVQRSIPIKRIYKDGIFEVSGKFSKTWRFFDVNYKVASLEKQMELFMAYCAFLNSLPVSAAAKITLFNRRLNQRTFSSALMLEFEGDGQGRGQQQPHSREVHHDLGGKEEHRGGAVIFQPRP